METGGPGSRGGAAKRPLHSAEAVDVASASSFRAFEILHLHLELRVEFGPPGPGPGSRGLSGRAMLELRCLLPEGASELRLDSHSCLEVTAATLRRGQPGEQQPLAESVPFHTEPFSHYGQALCVAFPQPCRAAERLELELSYRVGEGPGVSARGAPAPQVSTPPPLPRLAGGSGATQSRRAGSLVLLCSFRRDPHAPTLYGAFSGFWSRSPHFWVLQPGLCSSCRPFLPPWSLATFVLGCSALPLSHTC